MKTLKVRIKSEQDMPPEIICCSHVKEVIKDFYGKEVEVIPIPVDGHDLCNYCGKETFFKGFLHVSEPHILAFNCMDIDEKE